MCKYSVDMYVDLYRLTQKVEPIDDLLFFFPNSLKQGQGVARKWRVTWAWTGTPRKDSKYVTLGGGVDFMYIL